MKSWLPNRKVTAATTVGALVWIIQTVIPAWHNGVPMDVQALLPWITAVVSAYWTKLKKDL